MSSSAEQLSEEEVAKLAKLARLEVGDAERRSLQRSLNSILSYVRQLQSVDIRNVEGMSHVHGAGNVLREDAVGAHMPVAELLDGSPDHSGRYIRVPLIVEPGE